MRRRLPLASLGLLVGLTACVKDAPQTALEPQGPVARSIDRLSDPVFLVAGIVFVLVQGLILVAVFRFRDKGQAEPEQIHGNTRLEIAWTLAPALILFVIAVPTIKSIFDLSRKPADALAVTVTGHQFWWEYRYEDSGIVTANELVMPVGRPVALTLKSVDVIHSFWVPALAGKTDVIPGRVNNMSFTADHTGTYPGQCTEFCGLSHANMRNRAVALSPDEFDTWIEDQRKTPATPAEGTPAAEGLTVYAQKGCGGCHTVAGVSEGKIGPNLTHFDSRETFAGSIFTNTPENLRKWLADPLGVKPGNDMVIPGGPLNPDEVTKLIAYMETLK
ncbi:MAG: cytochrome c oxidase subunit II [Acidimicrobiales bacterium]